MADITVTLDEYEWMWVMAGLIDNLRDPTLSHTNQKYAEVAKKIGEQCPEGSGPWFGVGLLGGDN